MYKQMDGLIMPVKQSTDIQDRMNSFSEEEKERKLALFLELQPLLLKCLNLNHDINNPLTGILGYGEFILEDADNIPTEAVRHLEKVMECAERIKSMIDELSEVKSALSLRIDMNALTKQCEESSALSD